MSESAGARAASDKKEPFGIRHEAELELKVGVEERERDGDENEPHSSSVPSREQEEKMQICRLG